MLEEETKHFESIKEGLLEHHKGKFALIIGSELLGVFDTAEKAYETGIGAHGNVPMLIKPILEHEPVESMPALTLARFAQCQSTITSIKRLAQGRSFVQG